MLQDKNVHISANNPFAEAIFSFIEELRDNEDRKSIFYKEVVQVACRLYMADDDADQSLLSATGLSDYISDLQVEHKKKSGIRKAFTFVQPLVEGLMQYTSAVDVMIQADPTVSALIYGGAKLVLQLANEYTKYFEAITLMMEEIGVQLRCFHIYTREFATDKYLNGILCNSYRDILLFWRDASKILNQRGKRFFAGGILAPFKERYGKFKSKLDKNAQSVERMTQALHIQAQGTFNRSQSLQVQDLARVLERSSSPRPPDYSDSDTGTQHDEIKKWVCGGRFSRIDPKPDLERHLSSRHPGTAEWIFQDPIYTKWLTSGETSSVWLNASPGSGKSVLASSIIDNIQSSPRKTQKNVIYFFCRFDDSEKCKAISVLRSLSIQALKLVKYIPDELYELYKDECAGEDCYISTVSIAEKVLGFLLKRIDYVSVVIDGLDECHDEVILDSVIKLRDQKSHGITKWLFTSRNDAIVRKKFENSKWDILTVANSVVKSDIRMFLEDNSDLVGGTCVQLDRITELSEGNFLMMRLTIDPFRNEELTCSEEFEEALDTFQPELGKCWFRSLQRLQKRSEQIQELAQMIFMAVILAIQPMTFNELIELLSIKLGEEPSSRRRRTRSVILSACSPFVEVDYDKDFVNPTLRLVHKSIGDFLFQDPAKTDFVTENCYKFFVQYEQGHAEMGQRCLSYLSYNRYRDFPDVTLSENAEHGLLRYASIYWYKHIEYSGQNKETFEVVRDFMKSPNFWTCIKVQAKYAPHTFAKMAYKLGTDRYTMASGRQISNKDEVYYADALPSWLNEYDNEDDDLVWGYHMFVREWGDVLVKHPSQVNSHFAKVLGDRGFWWTASENSTKTKVTILDSGEELKDSFGIKDLELGCPPGWQFHNRFGKIAQSSKGEILSKYVANTIAKAHGEWDLFSQITVLGTNMTTTVYRFRSSMCDCEEVEDSDDDDDDDESSNEEKQTDIFIHEPSIWFLSVTNASDKTEWFHYATKKGLLQKSAPLFIPNTSWLLWPQDESTILAIDTKNWVSLTIGLPAHKTEQDYIMISQDHYYSGVKSQLHRASVYLSANDKCTIEHTIFDFDVADLNRHAVKTSPKLLSSQEVIWSRLSPSLNLPVTFCWHNSILYATLNFPTAKIIRFDPTSTVQIYKTHLHIPSSTYSRQPRFLISRHEAVLQASFILGAHPESELKPVVLQSELSESEGSWEEYDFEKIKTADGGGSMSNGFWKGAYAAKEQLFSVPIRSGLDWRRSVYVTCW